MKAEYINPFLESARIVIEQVANVKPSTGKLTVKDIKFVERHVWIQIGITGQMNGDIVFGLHEEVALKVASAMMGGFMLTELGEIGSSAISELGNMISGNASTMLYNLGITVDITPPRLVKTAEDAGFHVRKALSIPLILDNIGEIDLTVIVA